MKLYESQVVEYTLKHKVPVKNGYKDPLLKIYGAIGLESSLL